MAHQFAHTFLMAKEQPVIAAYAVGEACFVLGSDHCPSMGSCQGTGAGKERR